MSSILKFIHNKLLTVLCFIVSFNYTINTEAGNLNAGIGAQPGIQSEVISSSSSPEIRDAATQIFAQTVFHVSQQQGSQLMPFVEVIGMVRDAHSIDRMGSYSDPNTYEARYSTVTGENPKNDVRWVQATRYWKASLVDSWDQLRTIWSIADAYTYGIAMSFGRFYDRVIIQAALGGALTGKNRAQKANLPVEQRMVATDESNEFSTLNIKTLRKLRLRMKKTHAARAGEAMVLVVTADEVDGMLGQNQATSQDYASVKALVHGEIGAFMGFVFVETELVPHNEGIINFQSTTGKVSKNAPASNAATVAANAGRRCFAFTAQHALCFGTNMNIFARNSERPDIHYVIQIYYAAEFGAVRKEDVRVVEVITKSSGDAEITEDLEMVA